MAKPALPAMLLLLLHIACAGAGAGAGGGVDEACKKASDAKFCATLLQPHASQLGDNEPVKMGLAAMNATLGRVDELREFMVQQAVQEQTTPEELATLSGCLSNVGEGEGEGGVKVAVQLLNETKGAERDELLKMIDGAAAELTACLASLKNHMSPRLREAVRLTDESVQACSVARSLLP